MTHKSLGVTSFQMTTNADAMIVTANVDIGKMINSDAIKKAFREELKQLNVSSVPLNDYISEFKDAVNELMFTIFKNESRKILGDSLFKSGKELCPDRGHRHGCSCSAAADRT